MEVLVSKGFVVFAQNTSTVDYIRQAYALALSIRLSQSSVTNISLITNDRVPEEYISAFDKIIPIPFVYSESSGPYQTENRWKVYYATPYDETIVLDTDMLLLEDINGWWNYCKNYNIKFTNRIRNFKMEPVVDIVNRQAFISNNLTSPYCALYYFKKSEYSYEFFKILEFVTNNWEWCWTKFAPNSYQNWISMDLAVAITIEIMSAHEEVLDVNNPMEFVHMKLPHGGSWQSNVLSNFNGNLTVGNMRQTKLFHYVEKDFLTNEIVNKLEELTHVQTR